MKIKNKLALECITRVMGILVEQLDRLIYEEEESDNKRIADAMKVYLGDLIRVRRNLNLLFDKR